MTRCKGVKSIEGLELNKDFELYMSKISVIFDNPCFYENFSGFENLKLYAESNGVYDKVKLMEIVSQVGLNNRINEKVNAFSLGMKKRLQIAKSLVTSPKIIFLDEPFNGLDLDGSIKLRTILHQIKSEGISLVISTHLLNEIEEIADKVYVIKTGNIVSEININHEYDSVLILKVNNPQKASNIICNHFANADPFLSGNIIEINVMHSRISEYLNLLIQEGIEIISTKVSGYLQKKYIEAIGGVSHVQID